VPLIPNRRRSSCIGTYGRLLMNRRSCGAVHPGGGPSGPIGDGEALMEAWFGTPFVEMDSCSPVEWSGGALAGD
jgi:hypothetical protein